MSSLIAIAAIAIASSTPPDPPATTPPEPSVDSPLPETKEPIREGDLPPEDTKTRSEFTQSLRIGPSMFDSYGKSLGNSGGVWTDGTGNEGTSGYGVRIDYSLQRGFGHLRWHFIAMFEVTEVWCNFSDRSDFDNFIDNKHAEDVRAFVGSGIRYDSDPLRQSASILELDGTVGVSLAHVGLLGAHIAIGHRFGGPWEALLSLEGEVGMYIEGSAALMIGRSF